jgi:hypothetical protein
LKQCSWFAFIRVCWSFFKRSSRFMS